jgi:spore germination protein
MLHRITWFAIPVIGLTVLGAGLGAWGYRQQQQRQALAQQIDAQYDGSFHNLVTEMESLHDELGKALITNDKAAFQQRLRNIWRLTYAAQTEEDRLPFDLTQMHNTQRFLALVRRDTESWMNRNSPPASTRRELDILYRQSSSLYGQLADLQTTVFNGQHNWYHVTQALTQRKEPDAIVDGFKKMDTAAGEFLKSDADPADPSQSRIVVPVGGAAVGGEQAKRVLARFLGVHVGQDWTVQKVQTGVQVPVYQVQGQTPDGAMHATVTQQGGHVLMFHVDHSPSASRVDYVNAQEKARAWLDSRGFRNAVLTSANQFDHVAYFVFTPMLQNAQVLGQRLAVKVSLDNGHIIDYEGSNYFLHPLRDVPARTWTAAQLQLKLNPAFTVRMTVPVVALDETGHYQPAVAFYGTYRDDTYVIYMNAHSGTEMSVEKLTNYTA